MTIKLLVEGELFYRLYLWLLSEDLEGVEPVKVLLEPFYRSKNPQLNPRVVFFTQIIYFPTSFRLLCDLLFNIYSRIKNKNKPL